MKQYLIKGQRVTMEIGWSEAAMFMRVAGKRMDVELVGEDRLMAQLYQDNREFSFPITTGEAGIYRDSEGYYINA